MGWAHTIFSNDLTAKISKANGELCSLRVNNREYLHGGGLPEAVKGADDKKGWQHSEIVMFPIVGQLPDYRAQTVLGEAVLDRHGIVRLLPWSKLVHKHDLLVLETSYQAGIQLPNPGASPEKPDVPGELSWPFSFKIKKSFLVKPDATLLATLSIENLSSAPMPYALGWHPAVRLPADPFAITVAEHPVSFEGIRAASAKGAYKILNGPVRIAGLGSALHIRSEGFSHLGLWSPKDAPFLCVEPLTHSSPSGVPADNLLNPGSSRSYTVSFQVL